MTLGPRWDHCGESRPGGPPTHDICMCIVCPICDEFLGELLNQSVDEVAHQHMRTHYKFAGTDIDKENLEESPC